MPRKNVCLCVQPCIQMIYKQKISKNTNEWTNDPNKLQSILSSFIRRYLESWVRSQFLQLSVYIQCYLHSNSSKLFDSYWQSPSWMCVWKGFGMDNTLQRYQDRTRRQHWPPLELTKAFIITAACNQRKNRHRSMQQNSSEKDHTNLVSLVLK